MTTLPPDVPSPIDLQAEADARAWAAAANEVRPWRLTFFEAIAEALPGDRPLRVLELGSGPGFLAEHLLRRNPQVQVVLLDFSAPMQVLARERLQPFADRVTHVERSFRDEGWADGLGRFDAVVTNQAVHELRHRRHAPALHRQVRAVLEEGGPYLVSDHHTGEGGMSNEALYMSVEEQRDTLAGAGFDRVDELLRLKGMVLHRAS